MHKLIILGNGFDLAHGLKTSYSDYMQYLSDSSIRLDSFGGNNLKIQTGGIKRERIDPPFDSWYSIPNQGAKHKYLGVDFTGQQEPPTEFKVINKESILYNVLVKKKREIGAWSDFESLYANILYEVSNLPETVRVLHEEFDYLKNGFEQYLQSEVEDNLDSDDLNQYQNDFIKDLLIKELGGRSIHSVKSLTFLSFNYTSKLILHYRDLLSSLYPKKELGGIHIHGRLQNEVNPIIFGYGNENTNEYFELENLGNNEILKNFKTFQYLRTLNYKRVLTELSSNNHIKVLIIGHSLGLTDKTLLRTIFQHKNVRSIELTYHEKEENYFNLLYNASRLFDNNEMMREKIIPLEKTRRTDQSL